MIHEYDFNKKDFGRENRLLYRLAKALLKAENLEQILNVSASETIKAVDSYTVSIALWDKQKERLAVEIVKRRNGANRPPKIKEFKIGEGVAGLAALNKEIIFVDDIPHSKIFTGKCRSNASSLVCVPMVLHGQLIGVINISIGRKRALDKRAKEFLTVLASVVAVAIENARLIEKIKSENQLLTNVIDNSGSGVLVIGNRAEIVMANDYFLDIANVSEYDFTGKNAERLLKQTFGQSYTKKFLKGLSDRLGEDHFYEEIEIIRESEKFWLSVVTSYIKDDMGNIAYATIATHDITAEKNLLRAKDDLISTATHELRTPLTAIKGYLSMIRRGDAGELNRKQEKYLNIAYSCSERLVGLVEDLLKTLKIDENKLTVELVAFDIGTVILESIKNLRSKSEASDISIDYEHVPIWVYGDPVSTKHVVENLIDNAIKYTFNGGQIRIRVKNSANEVCIAVKDNGVGIAREYSRLVFDRFTRVSNKLSVKAGGTGLGLYIAKNLVEKQGGKIWFESQPKKGTTFYFTMLPATLALVSKEK